MKEVWNQSGIIKTCALSLSLEVEGSHFCQGLQGKLQVNQTQSSEVSVEPVWDTIAEIRS